MSSARGLLLLLLIAAAAAVAWAAAPPALVEEREQEGNKLWFHLDNLLERAGGQEEAGTAAVAVPPPAAGTPAPGETKEGAVKDKTGGSTTVLANKNFMSIMEDAEGRELSPHLAAQEGRLEAHEAARKREHEGSQKRAMESNQKHKRHLQLRRTARQREVEAAAAKGRALEEVRKAQAKTAELNRRTAELRKKVQEQNAKKHAKEWRFANGWRDYGGGYQTVKLTKDGNVCQIEGLMRRSTARANRILGTVSAECRPGGQLIFTAKVGIPRGAVTDTCRIDLLSDGRLHLTACKRDLYTTYWLALDGIRWNVGTAGTAVSFVSGWTNYARGFRTAGVAVEKASGGTLCTLSGLLRGSKWGYFGRVPAGECYPDHRLVFSANNHQYITRLDLLNNGYFLRSGGAAGHGWVSLDGTVYPGRGSSAVTLPLSQFYRHYDTSTWGPARFHRIGNVCMLSGLITRTRGNKATRAHVGTLPRGCRPSQRLIFSANSHTHDGTARVDVLPNGYIEYIGGSYASWISLSNINFIARR